MKKLKVKTADQNMKLDARKAVQPTKKRERSKKSKNEYKKTKERVGA